MHLAFGNWYLEYKKLPIAKCQKQNAKEERKKTYEKTKLHFKHRTSHLTKRYNPNCPNNHNNSNANTSRGNN